jgi:hypothetical protein
VSTQKKEVCGENAPGLHTQEVPPAWSIAARRGIDAGLLQDRPHCACRNLGAEPGEFVVDPSVTQKEFSRPATGSIGAARVPCGDRRFGGVGAGSSVMSPGLGATAGSWRG